MPLPLRHVLVSVAIVTPLSGQNAGLRPGLLGEYFKVIGNIKTDGVAAAAKPFFVHVDGQVNFDSTDGDFNGSKLADNLFVRWTGVLRVAAAGKYTFATTSDDGSRLYIDGSRVVENWGPHGMERKHGSVDLTAGDHAIRITFNEGGGGAGCIAAWVVPGGREVPIPKGVVAHDPRAARAARSRWDREKWKRVKRPKRAGNAGLTYVPTAGPVIATALNLGRDAQGTNTVYRGIVVRLDPEGQACVVFDADTLRMASAWTDNSLVLAGLPFTTRHGSYPIVTGEQVFRLRATPGWTKGANATDPRRGDYPPLGHLPKDWAHYTGLYMHGDRVVLAYTVGKSEVLESPSIVTGATGKVIVRNFQIKRDGGPMTLVLMDADSLVSSLGTVATVGTGAGGDVTAVGVSAAQTIGRLESRGGSLVLDLAASGGVTNFRVSYMRANAESSSGAELRDLVTSAPAVDFAAMMHGGPARWPKTFETKGEMASERDADEKAYVIDRITVPFDNEYEPRMRLSGMDFFADGTTAAVSTWDGDVWIVKGIDGDLSHVEWKRFATGLHEPLGLKIVDDVVYTVGDMQITRFHDLDKNGEADYFENFNNDWQLTSGFHAFCFDLQTDPQGRFYFAFGSPVRSGGRSFERMGDHHGSILRVSKDGATMERFATGLRAPDGIGVGPQGQVTSGDNEGTFVPRCPIHWISSGEFLGVVDAASLSQRKKLETTATRGDRVPGGRERHVEYSEMPRPLVWMPRSVDNSSGGQVWVTSDKWGPLQGHLLHMSYGTSSLFLVLKEIKGDLMQGGVVKIPVKFSSSAMRGRFNPKDGQLYVVGLKGWQTNAVRDSGFDRVRYTGRPIAMPVDLHTRENGVEITFSEKLDPGLANDVESFAVRAADIRWTQAYGTKEYRLGQRDRQDDLKEGWSELAVRRAKLSADGKRVYVEIAGFQPAHEMEISVDVEGASGKKIKTKIYCTVHVTD